MCGSDCRSVSRSVQYRSSDETVLSVGLDKVQMGVGVFRNLLCRLSKDWKKTFGVDYYKIINNLLSVLQLTLHLVAITFCNIKSIYEFIENYEVI